MASVVYMRIFLPESSMEAALIAVSLKEETVNDCLLEKGCTNNRPPSRTTPSLHDSIALLRSRYVNFALIQTIAYYNSPILENGFQTLQGTGSKFVYTPQKVIQIDI